MAKAIPIDEVRIGETVLIKPFEMIPVDGKVIAGSSFVDESTITGEPIPRDKRLGDDVFAGTANKQGSLEVKVTKESPHSTLAKIRELAKQARQMKAPTQQFIETFSSYYTPAVIALALLMVTIPTILFQGAFDHWLTEALSLIVIACPCALVISTPVSIFSALGNASKQGALIKGGKSLEAMAQIQAIALDKTRTLTFGRPIVSDILPYGEESKENVLECAARDRDFPNIPWRKALLMRPKRKI